MRYVTYDGQGNLTGCYLQNPVHDVYLPCSEEQAANWTGLKVVNGSLVPIGATSPMTAEQLSAAVQRAVQLRLDTFARTRNYDGILSACTYSLSGVTKFAEEGQYCTDARDASWAKCYEILDAVLAEERPMPTVEEAMAEMPALEWPL